jgi:tetratricopeptide (TPR) repeat protein
MRKTIITLLLLICSLGFTQASEEEYIFVSEQVNSSWSQLIVPDDINWTQRFILSEMKELRTQLEATRRELNEELNKRELEAVDRALSYSGNTVNFLWLIMTMAVTGFWLVGWRTMKDVRENLTNNFEAQIQKNVRVQQKRLEEFMQKFEQEQLSQSKEILETQELMQKKQEWAYYWSQFNREEDGVVRLELLEKIAWLNVEEDELIILIERALIYVSLGLWDKALETSDRWLELSSENTTLLYTKAESLVMLEESEEGLKVINNVLVVKPSMREEIMEDPTFENLRQDIEEIVAENSNII